MINVKIDSRKIEPGDTFVAIVGNTVDGHDYIEQAIKNGAKKIVIQKDLEIGNVEKIIVDDCTKWLNDYIVKTYKEEVNSMNIIGITGTNGKTTTAYLTYQMLNMLKSKTAYIGTIGFYIPDKDIIELPNTTPNILDLYELLLLAKQQGCQNVVMEVSSHALAQKRVEGLSFKTAAFTNLTQDHLDFHETMEKYLDAKLLILNQLNGSLIINADDKYAKCWSNNYNNIISLGYSADNYKIKEFSDTADGTEIKIIINNTHITVNTNLKSEFNVYNYLTSYALVKSLGYTDNEIISITKDIYPPKGRCEQIKVKDGIAVIDYAHTPDAVDKIITAFTNNKKGRVISIIGCGGDRDPKKRPIMGNIATSKSDFVVFTSDNPRTEDPQLIMNDILSGVKSNNYIVELDRKKAIIKALDMIKKDDVVLILGKGHEDYQIIGHKKIHLDDSEEVKSYLNNIKTN